MHAVRKRGRPLGTGIDDAATLKAIAELLARSPGLRPTTAIKRVVPCWTEAIVRRLQVKWKRHGRTLLNEARQAPPPSTRFPAENRVAAGGLRAAEQAFNAAFGFAGRSLRQTRASRCAAGLSDGAAWRAAAGSSADGGLSARETTAERFMREVMDGPARRMERQLRDPLQRYFDDERRTRRALGL